MMKKLILGLVALMALTFVACDDNDDPTMMTVGFEDITLNAAGLAQNDSISGSIESGALAVTCTWNSSWGYPIESGFTISNQTDTTNAGWMNSFSCIAESGANNSANYAVYNTSTDSLKFDAPVDIESVMLCNNAYAYISMLNGDSFAKKFGGIDGTDEDYFKLTVSLYDTDGTMLGDEDFYLADFRGDANYIVNEWTSLDLSSFKSVSYIKFSFESTDLSADWDGDGIPDGYNTPTYFCLDNINYYAAK